MYSRIYVGKRARRFGIHMNISKAQDDVFGVYAVRHAYLCVTNWVGPALSVVDWWKETKSWKYGITGWRQMLSKESQYNLCPVCVTSFSARSIPTRMTIHQQDGINCCVNYVVTFHTLFEFLIGMKQMLEVCFSCVVLFNITHVFVLFPKYRGLES